MTEPTPPLLKTERPAVNEEFTNEDIDRLAVAPDPESLWGQINTAFEARTGKKFEFIGEGMWNIREDTYDVVVGYVGIAVIPTEITLVSTRGDYGFVVEALATALAKEYDEAFAV